MSANVNSVFIAGNLTANPVISALQSGMYVASFSVAINERAGNKEYTSFIPVTAWGKLAQTAERYLSKGRSVLIEGRIKNEEYEKQGVKIRTIKVVANQIHFLDSNKTAAPTEQNRTAPPQMLPPPTWGVSDDDLPI